MNRHILLFYILSFLIYFIAFANSFFSDIFVKPLESGLSPSQLISGFFLIVFIIYNFFNSAVKYWNYLASLILLALYGLISALWSSYPIVAAVFSFKLLFIVNVFILAASLTQKNILNEVRLINLAKVFILITIVGQVVGRLTGVNTYDSEFSSAGLADNVSVIAGQLLFALPALFVDSFRKKTDFIYIFLILFSNVFTLRRSTLISLLLVLTVVFIVNLFSSSSSNRKRLIWILVSILFVVSFIYMLITTQIGHALIIRLNDLDISRGGTASGRYDFQRLGFMYSIRRDLIALFFGDGFGYSITVNVNNGFKPIGMHSDFLDIFIGLGIMGMVLYLSFLKKIWYQIKINPIGGPYFNSSLSFFVAIVSLGLFSGGFFEMKAMLGYITMGLIYSRFSDNMQTRHVN